MRRVSPFPAVRAGLGLWFAGAALASAVEPAAAPAGPDFNRDVYPFLKANCIACHNKTTTKADLNMETPEMMIKGGESGPGIVPGKGAESLIVLASLHQNDLEMPPSNNKSGAVNLTEAEIALLKQWIDLGAKDSARVERAVAWTSLSASVDPIYSLALTQDGRFAACGRSNQIYVYDLAARRPVGRVSDPALAGGAAHRALVQSLAFSPDGTRLASGSFREVKVWRAQPGPPADGKPAAPPPPAVKPDLLKKITAAAKVEVLSHAASADGAWVLAGCADGVPRVYAAADARLVIELRGTVAHVRKTAALERNVEAQKLEQAFQNAEAARVEAQEKALDELLKKANEAIVAMGKVLPEKQKALKPAADAREAAQKVVDEAAARVAAAGKPDAALEKQIKDAQDKLITARMAETSALAAVSATESNVQDAKDEVERITATKAANAKTLAAARAAAAAAKTAQDQATAELAALKKPGAKPVAKPLAVAFSPDAALASAWLEDGTLRVWAVATGQPVDEATPASAAASAPVVTAGPEGSFTVTRTSRVSAGAAPRWTLERTLGGTAQPGLFADRVNAVRFSPDGKLLATGGGELSRSGDIHLFDAATGKGVQTWKDRHKDAVLSLDFSPDGKRLASGAADYIARVTQVADGKGLNVLEGHTHHVTGVAFRADGRVLASAGADGVVLVWDMLSGERKKKIEGWTKEVTSLQYIGASNQLLTSAGDNRLRVITDEGADVRAINNVPDYLQAGLSTPGGALFIGGGEDSRLRVWDGASGKELAAFGRE